MQATRAILSSERSSVSGIFVNQTERLIKVLRGKKAILVQQTLDSCSEYQGLLSMRSDNFEVNRDAYLGAVWRSVLADLK